MLTNQVHVCRDQIDAPEAHAEVAEGERRVCSCGSNFVYRAGFNTAGHLVMDWWEAPPLPRPRRTLRNLLVRPRQGS